MLLISWKYPLYQGYNYHTGRGAMSKTTPTKTVFVQSLKSLSRKIHSGRSCRLSICLDADIVYYPDCLQVFQYADAALAEGFISTATRRSLSWQRQKRIVTLVPSQHRHGDDWDHRHKWRCPSGNPQKQPLISDDQYPYMTMDVCRLVAAPVR